MSKKTNKGSARNGGVATKDGDEPLIWHTQAMFNAILAREEMSLGIFVSQGQKPGEWQVVALETATKNTATAQQVFDEHAHKIVGVYATPFLALQAAESFAAAWGKRHKAASFREVCTCDEIDSSCTHVVREMEARP